MVINQSNLFMAQQKPLIFWLPVLKSSAISVVSITCSCWFQTHLMVPIQTSFLNLCFHILDVQLVTQERTKTSLNTPCKTWIYYTIVLTILLCFEYFASYCALHLFIEHNLISNLTYNNKCCYSEQNISIQLQRTSNEPK